ncbi:MAG: Nif3-like dinuclear metal center hexameric protein [Bacteroidales bacterium]|nr:Nif3-like dinuclear metal center hexameric protein [Bacteroidales bacterium]
MTVNDITSFLDIVAPNSYQESYDNAGLLVGSSSSNVTGVVVTLDVTPKVVEEAINLGYNLIVAHHPIIFKGLKKITGRNYVEKSVMLALKNDVAIYAMHTNFDSVFHGVNYKISQKLGIENLSILRPVENQLVKLVTFVPDRHADNLRKAMFDAGAGKIGNYDSCSYNTTGFGTFRAGENTHPFVGDIGELHREAEVRIETVVPRINLNGVIKAMLSAHPYEEVAYDVYPLDITFNQVGLGMVGDLPEPVDILDFLEMVKKEFNTGCIRYTKPHKRVIKRIAVCGGSGVELLNEAISRQADVFITADVKYHQFFDADGKITLVDIGHFESEQFTIDLIYDYLSKKFPKFAVQKSKVTTNPINYL